MNQKRNQGRKKSTKRKTEKTGIIESMNTETIEKARMMLNDGLPASRVSMYTGLSLKEIKNLNNMTDPQQVDAAVRSGNLYWKRYPNWALQFKKFPDEEFREIKNYKGYYFISNYGQVVTFHWKNPFVLRYVFSSGFFFITLILKKKTTMYPVHDLVYTYFVGEIEPGKKVVHHNKITTDNYYKNLELIPISNYKIPGNAKKFDMSLYKEIQSDRPFLNLTQVPVLQFDLDGKFIKEYPSMKEARASTGLLSTSISTKAVEPFSAGGYQWRLKNDPIFENGIIDIKPLPRPCHYKRKILQFDMSGNLIEEYSSIMEAARAVKGLYSKISHCLSKISPTAHGFQWKYKEDPDLHGVKPKLEPIHDRIYKPQPILRYSLKGKFIKEYGSIAEAAHECGLYYRNIKSCLDGINKTSAGYQWRYKKGADIPLEIPAIKPNLNRSYPHPRPPVLQFSKEGKFIKEYSTVKKAARTLKISYSEIMRCLVYKTKNKNFQWRYKDDPLFKNGIVDLPRVRPPKTKSCKSVLQYDIEGNFKKKFNSINEAARYVGITTTQISTCLAGKLITTAGFIWVENIPGHEKIVIEKQRQLKKRHLNSLQPQPVLQFNLNGKFIAKYPSMVDASRKTGTSLIQIQLCAKGMIAYAKNWQWRSADDPMFINGIVDIEPIQYSGRPRSKPILQFDENGIFLKEYQSMNEAARTMGLAYTNLYLCIKGNSKTAGGFQWRCKEDPLFNKGIVNIEPVKRVTNSTAILQFDLKGRYIREYPSIKMAANALGISSHSICDCASGKTMSAADFQWYYRDDPRFANGIEDIEEIRRKARKQPVLQFDKNGNYIAQYSTSKQASWKTGTPALNINLCAQGKSNAGGGFQWRYLNDPLFKNGIVNIGPVKKRSS